MSLLNTEFEGFLAEDFDAYLAEKWSNNLHNLSRMKVKDKVQRLIKSIHADLNLPELKVEASSEIPSVWNGRKVEDQWAYLLRGEVARRQLQPVLARRTDLATRVKVPAEHYRHALLCVRIDHEQIEIGVRISQHATVDLANLQGRASGDSETLEAIMSALPEGMGVDGCPGQTEDLLAALAAARTGERDWVLVCKHVSRDEAIELGAEMITEVQTAARGVLPLFNYLHWTPDNDYMDVETELTDIANEQAERQKSRIEAREEKAKAHADRAEKARARTASKVDVEAAWRKMQQERVRTSMPPAPAVPPRRESPSRTSSHSDRRREPPQRQTSPSPPKKSVPSRNPPKQSTPNRNPPKRHEPESPPPRTGASAARVAYEVGEKCRFRRGLLGGKEGVVVSVDQSGQYTVKTGLFEVNVKSYELEKLS